MDIRYHLNILKRWRRMLVVGVVLGIAIAVLVTFRVGPGGLEWRADPTYTTSSRTFITQPGFPWGRATLGNSNPGQPVPQDVQKNAPSNLRTFADPARFSELAVVYSYLASSDQIRNLVVPRPGPDQGIRVATIPNPATNEPLPLLEIVTTSSSAAGARRLNMSVIAALRGYLRSNVLANQIPPDQRVQLQVLNPPRTAVLTSGRSYTGSVIAFILALVATVVAIYVRDNLRLGALAEARRADETAVDGLTLSSPLPNTPAD